MESLTAGALKQKVIEEGDVRPGVGAIESRHVNCATCGKGPIALNYGSGLDLAWFDPYVTKFYMYKGKKGAYVHRECLSEKREKEIWEETNKERKLPAEEPITARLDEIAGELEVVDPRLALALDRVSDQLEHYGAIKTPDPTLHKEDLKRSPEMYHSLETMGQVKEALKDPKVEEKIKEYIKKTHNLDMVEGYVSDFKYNGDKVHFLFQFKTKYIDPEFFKEHKVEAIFASGKDLFEAGIDISLKLFQ